MPITVSGTSITFNDATVQTTAAGGAPAYGAVGSYINAFYGVDGGIATGQGRTLAGGAQIAGSSLWINQYGTGSSSSSARVWSPGSSISASVNSSTFPSSGMTTLTGTWRVVQPSVYVARSDVGCGNAQSYWFSVFFVRVA